MMALKVRATTGNSSEEFTATFTPRAKYYFLCYKKMISSTIYGVIQKMSVQEEIDLAIAAHRDWKFKLRTAIDTGKCESTPEKVKMDNNCSFGKWLHERIDPAVKHTPHYNEIVDLHAKFHQEAGSILELALNGNVEKARDLMEPGSTFVTLSSNLTLKMMDWKKHLASAN